MATRRTKAAKKTKATTKKKAPAAKSAKPKPKAKAKAKAAPAKKTSKKTASKVKSVAKAAKKTAKKTLAKVKAVAKAVVKGKAKSNATYLGRADSLESSISLLVVDGAAAAEAWKGVDPDDLDSLDKATNELAKLGSGLDSGKARAFKLGSSTGLGFQLSVGKGIAHVFRANDRLVVAEGFVEDVENPDFLKYVASPPASGAVEGGTLEAKSGVLAIMIPGGSYEDLPQRLSAATDDSKGARIGSEMPGLLVKAGARKYRLLVEPETSGTFGQAARAVLEPA